MNQIKVSFDNPKDVLDFVNRVTKYPFDLDMTRGSYMIDGKSVLGIMGLGVGNIMDLKIYGDVQGTECQAMLEEISPYVMA